MGVYHVIKEVVNFVIIILGIIIIIYNFVIEHKLKIVIDI